MQHIHVIRSASRTNIVGSGSTVFGFKRADDAMLMARRLREMSPCMMWYTRIGLNKYTLSASPRPIHEPYTVQVFEVETVNNDAFVSEMMCSNLSVRLIDDISIEYGNLMTLHSHVEYTTNYTNKQALEYLVNNYSI